MTRIDSRLERPLLAVAVAVGAVLLLSVPNGEPILAGDTIAIGTAIGVAVFASDGNCCRSCTCCQS